ncbi:hypothetical protein HDV63DRAFT_95845 [Trichoderma sp. SZMC 28014]
MKQRRMKTANSVLFSASTEARLVATARHGVTEAVQRMQTHLVARWKSRQEKRRQAAMYLSIPQAPRWLVAGNEATKQRDEMPLCPFCGASILIQLVHRRTIRSAIVVVPLPCQWRRSFVLSPPPLDASRNSAIEETQKEEKKKSDSNLPAVPETLVDGREKQRRHTDSYMGE